MLNVTKLNLCTKLSNDSWNVNFAKKVNLVNLTDVMQNGEETKLDLSGYQSLSFLMTVTVSFLPTEGNLFPRPVTYFVSKFPSSLLGISGEYIQIIGFDIRQGVSDDIFVPRGEREQIDCHGDGPKCPAQFEMR